MGRLASFQAAVGVENENGIESVPAHLELVCEAPRDALAPFLLTSREHYLHEDEH